MRKAEKNYLLVSSGDESESESNCREGKQDANLQLKWKRHQVNLTEIMPLLYYFTILYVCISYVFQKC